MKFTAVLLLAAALQVSAIGKTQSITLTLKEAPLEKVFQEIKKQTGYSFVYNNSLLDNARRVDISVSQATVDEVLRQCFTDQPLTYTIVDNTIIVKPKKETPNESTTAEPIVNPPIDISGKVTDKDGNPLEGATVAVKGTKNITKTDVNGVFVLKGVDESATLEISFAEHEKIALQVNSRTSLMIALKRDEKTMGEVIINKGAYSEKQKYSVSSVGHIDAKQIEKHPVQNPLLAIQGLIPGVEITQLSGLPGGGVKVRIQGINTLRFNDPGATDPLIVIDGVPYSSTLSPMGTIIGNFIVNNESLIQGGNPLNYINPADIETIDILKDADATAIYGSRAANGAILITTKKGKAGPSKVSVNLQQGWGKVTRRVDMMNTRQYLDMRYEALRNDNLVPTSIANPPAGSNLSYAPDLTLWDTTRYTDWQKVLIGGTAKYTNINISMSGGNAATRYMIGGTFRRQTTVFPGDFDDKIGDIHFNIASSSTNQRLKLGLTGSYLIDFNHLSNVDLTSQALFMEPNAPALYNVDGSLNWAPNSAGASTWSNPLDYLLASDFKNTTKNLVSNVNISYRIFKDLEFSSNFGYTDLRTNLYTPTRLESVRPEARATSQRTAALGNRTMNSWIIEPQLTYSTSGGKGKLDGLVGSTILKNSSDMLSMVGIGFTNDLLMKSLANAPTVILQGASKSEYRYNALFARLNYNWDGKYIINLTARRDGSSRFGDKNKFHNFWSAGIAWLFSNEKWVSDEIPFLSYGKLRGNFGTTGSDAISDYSYLSLYQTNTGLLPYQTLPSMSPTRLTNPYLQWEETRKLQGGIDLGFFRDRVILNATYVYNRSSNQLISYTLPSVTGFNSITKNFPATIQNTAWELVLTTANMKGSQISWTTSINLTIPKNKLVSFPGIEKTSYGTSTSTFVVGQPLGLTRVYPFAGVDPGTGKYMVYKYDGTVTSSPSSTTDGTVLLNLASRFYGGMQNSFTYKGFQLDFLFQFVRQMGLKQLYYNGSIYPGSFATGSTNLRGNQPVTVLNHWRKPGDISDRGRYAAAFPPLIPGSDALYSYDASYIRLKNVALSWQLPSSWIQKAKIQNTRLYFRGENLATISKYSGLDPENQSISSLPPLQVWTVGAQIEF